MTISDHSLAPLEPDNDAELVKWARYGVAQIQRERLEMSARDMFNEARIRVLGAACRIAKQRGNKAGERSLWADYKKAHAARSPELVAALERRMGVR